MPIDEQIIKLALDLGSSPEEAAKLAAQIDRINASGERAATDGLKQAETEINALLVAARSAAIPLEEVSLEMLEGSRAALSETQALAALGVEMRQTTTAANSLEASATRYNASAAHAVKGSHDLAGAVLQMSYGVQDVAIGSFAGLVNNLDQVALKLGASGPVVIGVSLLATGIYVASRAIGEFSSSLMDASRNEIPKTGDALKDVTSELDATTKQLDKFREKQGLTNEELAEFNRLSQEEIRLTREKDAMKKEREIAEKAAGLQAAGVKEDAKATAEALQGSFGDQKDRQDLIQRVLGQLPTDALDAANARAARANAELQDSLTRDPLNLVGMQGRLQKAADEAMREARAESARLRADAESMVNRSIVEGDQAAFGRLRGIVGRQPGGFTDAQRAALDQASPEARRRDEQFEQEISERQQQGKERREREKATAKAREAREKAAEADEQASREMEEAGNEGYRRSQAKLAANIEKAMKAKDDMNERLDRLFKKQDAEKADAEADVIKQATGGAFGADLTREAARRSVELQRMGLDANQATQQAIAEALQAMQMMAVEVQMQRQASMQLIGQAQAFQQMMRAEFNPRLQPFQPRAR